MSEDHALMQTGFSAIYRDSSLSDRLEQWCRSRRCTKSEVIRVAIEQYLDTGDRPDELYRLRPVTRAAKEKRPDQEEDGNLISLARFHGAKQKEYIAEIEKRVEGLK